jgi:hypothetical protein
VTAPATSASLMWYSARRRSRYSLEPIRWYPAGSGVPVMGSFSRRWSVALRRVSRGTQAWAEGLSTMRLMTGKRAETLLELMYQIEYFTLARAWAGLTDDEFFWEPYTTTWSVRRQDECRTSNPFGAGEWAVDFEIPEPTPVPMTTIAWLYWHIGSMPGRLCDIDFLGGTRTVASGWTAPYLTHHPIFTSAAEAVSALRDGWQRLRGAIERADDDQLEVTTAGYTYAAEPPRGGLCVAGPPGPAHPATHFIVATLNEVGHHGTQIGALRDAYAWRRSTAVDTAT